MTDIAESAHPDQVLEVLKTWLAQALAKNSKDPLASAYRLAIQSRDAHIQALAAAVRAYRKLAPDDGSEEAARLRSALGPGTVTNPGRIAGHLALRAFTEANGPLGRLLEEAATDMLSMARHCDERAASADDPQAAERLHHQARNERESALRKVGDLRQSLARNPAPEDLTGPAARASQPKSMPARTLQRLADSFRQELESALSATVRFDADTPNRLLPDPGPHLLTSRPQATFGHDTLKAAGLDNLTILLDGPQGAQAVADEVSRCLTVRFPQMVAAQAEAVDMQARQVHQRFYLEHQQGTPEVPRGRLLPEKPVAQLWQRQNPGQPMAEHWLIISRGRAGTRARARAAKKALAAWQERQLDYETRVLNLDEYGRIEHRSNYSYQGPPPQWSLEQLVACWSPAHPGDPMPRHWRALAPDATPGIRQATGQEAYSLHLYNERLTAYLDSVATGQSTQTQRKKHQLASASLMEYQAAQEACERAFLSARIEPPPPTAPEPLPELPGAKQLKPPSLQQPMVLQGVATIAPRPRRQKAAPATGPAPQPTPNMRLPI